MLLCYECVERDCLLVFFAFVGGWEDGPLPVYTPLNFSMDGGGGMVDEGGGGKCAVSECSGYIRPVT